MTNSILWRRIDLPGHDSARIFFDDLQWRLEGTAVFGHESNACRLDYVVLCDAHWRTQAARVTGWTGRETVDIEISAIGDRWVLDGVEYPALDGCIDIDLGFTPATNLLPIRRLNLAVGEDSNVKAAWLGFPGFRFEVLNQNYRRLDASTYRYESAGGSFVRELRVNEAGFATLYPDFFEAEPLPPAR